MKHSILKRAIQVKAINRDQSGTYITLNLLSYRNVIFYDTIHISEQESLNKTELQLIDLAVIEFKKDQRYVDYIKHLDDIEFIENLDGVDINRLTIEYNKINDVSNLKYLETSYPYPSPEDFSKKITERYFAKYLNQKNIFLEINFDDYISLTSQNPSVHYEAYDYFSLNWLLSGSRDEILNKNSAAIEEKNKEFPGFKSFHTSGEYKAGPYYITVYDEIRNLYTVGRELVYSDTIHNFVGYYHLGYSDGNLSTLISGKNAGTGENRVLLEVETYEQTPVVIETQDIIDDVKDSISSIVSDVDNFLSLLNGELNKLELQSNIEIQKMQATVDKSIESMVTGTDLEDVFKQSKGDYTTLAKSLRTDSSPSSRDKTQAKIEESYSSKSIGTVGKQVVQGDRISINNNIKNSKTPKVRIPAAPMKHGVGESHADPLGF